MGWIEERIERQLDQRRRKGSLRRLPASATLTTGATTRQESLPRPILLDFSSNDYLGLSRDKEQQELVERTIQYEQRRQNTGGDGDRNNNSKNTNSNSGQSSAVGFLGATGSRLLSGDAPHFHHLEQRLARIHQGQDALLCNSGYDANLAVVSSLPCDCILHDEYIHNSLHMGVRLWQTSSTHSGQSRSTRLAASFQHNNLQDLREKLRYHSSPLSSSSSPSTSFSPAPPNIVILIESIYSMDGDIAPIRQILDLAWEFDARVVVDEAHGLGVTGTTAHGYGERKTTWPDNDATTTAKVDAVVHNSVYGSRIAHTTAVDTVSVLAASKCTNHPALAYAVYTFGKAAGCHGAVIVCPRHRQKEYLVNFAYPIVYSTALPYHTVVTIQCAYTTMLNAKGRRLRQMLQELIHLFQELMTRVVSTLPVRHHDVSSIRYRPSHTAIQALIVPGNDACSEFCQRLYDISGHSVRLYPIKSPTVPVGQERVRIVLHAHNTRNDVQALVQWLAETIAAALQATNDVTSTAAVSEHPLPLPLSVVLKPGPVRSKL